MFVIMHNRHGYCIGPGAFDTRQEAAVWLFKRCTGPVDLFNWKIVPAY